MNKIYKVMYSKVKQCCVVVSEIAKSHGRHTKSSVAKSSAVLTATVGSSVICIHTGCTGGYLSE